MLLSEIISKSFSDNKTLSSENSLTIKRYCQRIYMTINHFSIPAYSEICHPWMGGGIIALGGEFGYKTPLTP